MKELLNRLQIAFTTIAKWSISIIPKWCLRACITVGRARQLSDIFTLLNQSVAALLLLGIHCGMSVKSSCKSSRCSMHSIVRNSCDPENLSQIADITTELSHSRCTTLWCRCSWNMVNVLSTTRISRTWMYSATCYWLPRPSGYHWYGSCAFGSMSCVGQMQATTPCNARVIQTHS